MPKTDSDPEIDVIGFKKTARTRNVRAVVLCMPIMLGKRSTPDDETAIPKISTFAESEDHL